MDAERPDPPRSRVYRDGFASAPPALPPAPLRRSPLWWLLAVAAAIGGLFWLDRSEAAGSDPAAAAAAAGGASCRAVAPFYWEIGSRDAVLASGSVGAGAPKRDTVLGIASASKLLYGAYAAQSGALSAQDRQLLNMTAGYSSFEKCRPTQTVAACAAAGNDDIVPAAVGRFAYSGGDMQRHAAQGPLGNLSARQLGPEMSRVLGAPITFRQPLIAGGAQISPAGYATVLQRMLRGELRLGSLLGLGAVCTDKRACPGAAVSSPAKAAWGYGAAHWIEAPEGDGSFSSAGAFGFYPWIDASRTLYGIVAPAGSRPSIYWQATQCGAAIRAAFVGPAAAQAARAAASRVVLPGAAAAPAPAAAAPAAPRRRLR
jgi:hypothetical protein